MSWNKNTLDLSEMDIVIRGLNHHKVLYTLEILGKVAGHGLNDRSDQQYEIRRLVYEDKVLLEQMIRHTDCDMDDLLVMHEFTKETEPKKWKLEIIKEDE